MKIVISPKAEKEIRKISKLDQIAISSKIRKLSNTDDLTGEEKLQGFEDIYRIRIGNYRIVYRRRKEQIYIVVIRHRKDVYELLKHFIG